MNTSYRPVPNPAFERDSPRSGRAPQFYVRVLRKIFVKKLQSRTVHKIFDFFLLQWVSDSGRLFLRIVSFGKFNCPKTDSLAYETALKNTNGFVSRLWLTVRYFVIDYIYFPVGALFLAAVFFISIILFVKLVGSIPPVHEWR